MLRSKLHLVWIAGATVGAIACAHDEKKTVFTCYQTDVPNGGTVECVSADNAALDVAPSTTYSCAPDVNTMGTSDGSVSICPPADPVLVGPTQIYPGGTTDGTGGAGTSGAPGGGTSDGTGGTTGGASGGTTSGGTSSGTSGGTTDGTSSGGTTSGGTASGGTTSGGTSSGGASSGGTSSGGTGDLCTYCPDCDVCGSTSDGGGSSGGTSSGGTDGGTGGSSGGASDGGASDGGTRDHGGASSGSSGNGHGNGGRSSSSSGGASGGTSSGSGGASSGSSGASSGGTGDKGGGWTCDVDENRKVTCRKPPKCCPGTHPSACGACVPDTSTDTGDCTPPGAGGCWVTGGGFILDADGRDSFGGNAMPMKSGAVRGEWEHQEHDTHEKAHGRASYIYCRHVNEPGPGQPGGKKGFNMNQVYFGGNARWFSNGAWSEGYWFDVVAEDHGEPGSTRAKGGNNPTGGDYYHFTLRKTAGANQSGTIVYETKGNLSGGNIQIHPPNNGHPYVSSPMPPWVQLEQ